MLIANYASQPGGPPQGGAGGFEWLHRKLPQRADFSALDSTRLLGFLFVLELERNT